MAQRYPGAIARTSLPPHDGYALLAVLWICAGVATLGLGISAAAGEAIGTARNRVALTEAEWLARGCIARVRSSLAVLMHDERQPSFDDARLTWLRLDSFLPALSRAAGGDCTLSLRAVGARLDVNAADEQLLARVFRQAGIEADNADSLAAALADWKDADDVTRPLGAERDWYAARSLIPPSNRPFADTAEIALVRGMSAVPWQALLDVEPGALSLAHASEPILAVLPGFTSEAVARVIELRHRHGSPRAFLEIGEGLTAEAADSVTRALPQLAAMVSLEPRAWLLQAESRSGRPAVGVILEIRLERVGSRARVARTRIRVR